MLIVLLWQNLKELGLTPDKYSLEILLKCRAQAGHLDHTNALLQQLEQHHKEKLDGGVYLLMASMFALLGRKIAQVKELVEKFDNANSKPDSTTVDAPEVNEVEDGSMEENLETQTKGKRIIPLELLAERELLLDALTRKQSGYVLLNS